MTVTLWPAVPHPASSMMEFWTCYPAASLTLPHDRFARSSLDAVAVRLDDAGACTGGWDGVNVVAAHHPA